MGQEAEKLYSLQSSKTKLNSDMIEKNTSNIETESCHVKTIST